MRSSMFTHDFLLLFAGPLVWAVHFVAIYGFAGVVCARPAYAAAGWLGVGVLTWGVVGAGALALAVLAACLRLRPRTQERDNRAFVRRTSIALNLLAMLAIVWETLSVFLIPACEAAT